MDVEVKNFDEFREKARSFIRDGLKPQAVHWRDHGNVENFLPLDFDLESDLHRQLVPVEQKTFRVPKEFIKLGEIVECHRSEKQWYHLYSLLCKIKNLGPSILKIAVDHDVMALEQMKKQIKRDIHKMHAFVRFRKKEILGQDLFMAWYEPDHRILEKAVPFFVRRFGSMSWIIATPDGAAYWDQHKLEVHAEPTKKSDYEAHTDEFEKHWLTYYSKIFNPARVKVKAMKNEMPSRFWKNLPEAQQIPELLADASTRVTKMHEKLKKQQPITTEKYLPSIDVLASAANTLDSLRAAAKLCEGCPLYEEGTQSVFGEGSSHAKVVLVGEQPGNDEDLEGRPFVGPAGKVLRDVLSELKIDAKSIYITNAVKHFHNENRGKFRLHKKPTALHIRACNPWLERELEAVKPRLIVCLGATATQAVIGYPVGVTQEHGKFFKTRFSSQALVTFHPSFLLRTKDEADHKALVDSFKADLSKIKDFVD